MSVGGTRSPYRPPCGYTSDAPEVWWLGVPWQHYVADDASVTRLQNTTMVPNYLDPSCPDYTASEIVPYQRPATDSIAGCGDECEPPCGPWPEPVPPNTYAAYDPAETVNLSSCRKVGYKVVYGRKAWHGRFGFVPDNCCGFAGPHPSGAGPSTTKYRTLAISATDSYYSADLSPHTTSYATSWDSTVDQYTSNVTYSGSCTYIVGSAYIEAWWGVYGLANLNYCGASGTWSGWDDSLGSAGNLPNGQTGGTIIADLNSGNLTGWSWDGTTYSGGGGGAGGLNQSGYNITIVSATETEISISCEWQYYEDGIPSVLVTDSFAITVTLSNGYTGADLNDDLDDLLGVWDLSDDTQIPWRIDTACASGPYVGHMEGPPTQPAEWPGGPSGTFDGETTSVSGMSGTYTGDVLGSPNPAGYDPYWDFRFQVIDYIGDGYEVAYFGDSAPTWAPFATQWTNLDDGASLLPCAFRAYNGLTDALFGLGPYYEGYLLGSKYAEVMMLTAPSHDWARPCGPKDAATIDQASIGCFDPGDPGAGTLRWPDCANPCPTPPAAGGEWNDNTPKGDWCLAEWTFNFRDNFADPGDPEYRPVTGPWKTVACTQECSEFVPCCPAVVYITNNGESSANSQTFTIPSLAPDDCYGAQWQMAPMQWLTDPLWQAPAAPCDLPAGTAWTEDDGSGKVDTDENRYYPQRPWEECRCSPPEDAPALPEGCFIGCLDTATINEAGSYAAAAVEGNVCQPPAPGNCWMPWWTWATNRLETVLGNGRFSCDYADPMAICADDSEVEPP